MRDVLMSLWRLNRASDSGLALMDLEGAAIAGIRGGAAEEMRKRGGFPAAPLSSSFLPSTFTPLPMSKEAVYPPEIANIFSMQVSM